MPKRLSKTTRRREIADPNLSAFRVIQQTMREDSQSSKVVKLSRPKNAAAVALGRKGGLKSAEVRREKIDPDERRRIASNAARARWAKKDGDG